MEFEAYADLTLASRSTKRQKCTQDGSPDFPIVIYDSDSLETAASWQEPQERKQRRSLNLGSLSQNIPIIHRTISEKLGAYDDTLTDILVDRIYYWGSVRKYCTAYLSTHEDRQSVILILRDVVISRKDFPEAENQLLALPSLKRFSESLKTASEKDCFRRHMRRYLNIYLPDCAFELTGTNRYTGTTYEASVIARKPIARGEDIKYLCGIRAIMTEVEEEDLNRRGNGFSIVETSRNNAISFLFGPACRLNHDCDANARLTPRGTSGMVVIAVRDIKIGEEITVSYSKRYFGKDNCQCRCKTCEDHCRNGWASEDQTTFHSSPKSPSRYMFRHKDFSRRVKSSQIDVGAHVQYEPQVAEPVEWTPTPPSYDPTRSLETSDDHLTLDALAEPSVWTHSERCLATASQRMDKDNVLDFCPVCQRHKGLYGYQWPQTKHKGRYDIDRRIYPPGPW